MASVHRKIRIGVVVSDRMDKSVVIKVDRMFRHPIFKKIIRRSKKYKVHDERNECGIGDTIKVIETRPLSKDKRWRLLEIVKRVE